VENFCNERFGDSWGIYYYFTSYLETQKHQPEYIICFENEEDAILFKLTFTSLILND